MEYTCRAFENTKLKEYKLEFIAETTQYAIHEFVNFMNMLIVHEHIKTELYIPKKYQNKIYTGNFTIMSCSVPIPVLKMLMKLLENEGWLFTLKHNDKYLLV